MSKEKFNELTCELRSKFGLVDSQSLHKGCNLRVNDVAFTLLHGDHSDEDSLYIYCDFGTPSVDYKAYLSQGLMQTRLNLFGNSTPSFGFNAETGRAALMNRVALSQTTLDSLIGILNSTSTYIRVWCGALSPSSSQKEQASQTGLASQNTRKPMEHTMDLAELEILA
jgi:hypothetical protein